MGLRDKIALAFAGLLLFFIVAGLLNLRSHGAVADAQRFQQHTYQVIGRLDDLLVQVLNQETAVRGFAITAQDAFLKPYRDGSTAFDHTLEELLALTADNIEQQVQLRKVRDDMLEWRRVVAIPLTTSDNSYKALAAARDADLQVHGKQLVDGLRISIAAATALETRLLAERTAALTDGMAQARSLSLLLLLACALFVVMAVVLVSRRVTDPLLALVERMRLLADGETLKDLPSLERSDEVGDVARALEVFRSQVDQLRQFGRVKTAVAEIIGHLQAARSLGEFGDILSSGIGTRLHSGWVMVFVWDAEKNQLPLCGGYAVPKAQHGYLPLQVREGLVGECHRLAKPLLVDASSVDARNAPSVQSGGVELPPRCISVLPLLGREGSLGVIEIAGFEAPDLEAQEFLEELCAKASLNLESLLKSLDTQRLLEESQAQAEELQASEEALRSQREELSANNEILRDSTTRLYEQGRQLRVSQDELRAQAIELQRANEALREQGTAVEKSRMELAASNTVLERTSRYKSEFLANVSHELRTPLNSLLLLSKSLVDNHEANLTEDQLESARIIHDGGGQLLRLINDILDLSKIEAGKMEALVEDWALTPLLAAIEKSFQPVAQGKGVAFAVQRAAGIAEHWHTDSGKLMQILNNLLGNAFKFTASGSVSLRVEAARDDEKPVDAAETVALRVSDSGIGISPAQQEKLFQAFEQADSGTSRRYGGTGLGLAISRQLAQLLGGDVQMQSTPGVGSTFSLLLPVRLKTGAVEASAEPALSAPASVVAESPLHEQRRRRLLLVEDDADTRHAVRQLLAQEHLEIVEAADAEAAMLALQQRRFHLLVLDLALPGTPGEVFLKQASSSVRLPPVVVYSAGELDAAAALELRAYTDSIVIKGARSPERLLDEVRRLLRPEVQSSTGGIAGRVSLLSEADTTPPAADMLPLPAALPPLQDRCVLVVDDDMRNIFALSRALRARGLKVFIAQDAQQGLASLEQNPEIEAVLMDVMMPGMDGNTAIQRIRANPRWQMLPVIAVTAKAMRGDREISLAAGASDYLTKPVDLDQLLRMLARHWKLPENAE